MNCPKCDNPSRVLETRAGEHLTTRRRRQCSVCGHRFTTVEMHETASHLGSIQRTAQRIGRQVQRLARDLQIAQCLHEQGGHQNNLGAEFGLSRAGVYHAAERGRAYAAQVRHPLRASRR